MTKQTSVWAIRVNPHLIELRAAKGAVKIIKSSLKKSAQRREIDYNSYPSKMKLVPYVFDMKQTFLIGGRSLGFITQAKLAMEVGPLGFEGEDVVKLKSDQAAKILRLSWRRTNL